MRFQMPACLSNDWFSRWFALAIALLPAVGLLALVLSLSQPRPVAAQSSDHMASPGPTRSVTPTLSFGSQITVTAVVSDQRQPAVAYNSTDVEYLVAWKSESSSDAGDIYARRVDGDGILLGSAFAVVNATNIQQDPSAAYSPDAETYLVTWTGTPTTSTHTAVYGHLVTSDGQLSGSQITIDSSGSNPRSSAETIYDPASNRYVVVWMRKTGSDQDIYATFVHSSTGAVYAAFPVADSDTPSTTVDFVPDVATDGTGAFLAVWRRGAGSQDIFGQRFDSSGLVGGVINIATQADAQNNPAVTFDETSQQYLVTWEDKRSGEWEIYGQRIEPDGDLVGSNFLVASQARGGAATDPDTAALDNHYLVGFDQLNNTYLNLVNSNGTPLSENVLSNLSGSNQQAVALASDGDTVALAAWASNHGSQGYDIYARLITITGTLRMTAITED